jgi:hypothetical protein
MKTWNDLLAYAKITETTINQEDEVIQEGQYKTYTEKEVQRIEKLLEKEETHYWLTEPVRLNPDKKYMIWIENSYSMFGVISRFGFIVEDV